MTRAQIMVRPHLGGFHESMRDAVLIAASIEGIKAHTGAKPQAAIEVKPYEKQRDPRNGWLTHIITIDGVPWGFSSGPLEDIK